MSNNKQERIVCAATEYKYNHLADAVIPRLNYSDSYADDHEYIMSQHDKDVVCIKKTDGFITNKNRFVDAEEALKITGWGNQLRFKDRKYLLPEDLY